MSVAIGSLWPASVVAAMQRNWNATLKSWAVCLRRQDQITAGSGRKGIWAAPAPTGVHAAVADTGAPQTINSGLTQPSFPSVLTATVSGTLANVTPVSVVITGTDANGAVQTETLPLLPAPGIGQVCTVIGTKPFATVTSYMQPACGRRVSIAVGLAVPAKRFSSHAVARERVVAARQEAIAAWTLGFRNTEDVTEADHVLFSDGTLFEVRDAGPGDSIDWGHVVEADLVRG